MPYVVPRNTIQHTWETPLGIPYRIRRNVIQNSQECHRGSPYGFRGNPYRIRRKSIGIPKKFIGNAIWFHKECHMISWGVHKECYMVSQGSPGTSKGSPKCIHIEYIQEYTGSPYSIPYGKMTKKTIVILPGFVYFFRVDFSFGLEYNIYIR